MAIDFEKGFVAFPRGLTGWEWYDDLNTRVVFMHLLLTANWEEKRWRGVVIPAGGQVTSVAHLARATGLTSQNVRTALNHLVVTKYLTIKTTSKFSVISINNYLEITGANKVANKQLTNNQQTANNNHTINTIKTKKQSSSPLPPSRDVDRAKPQGGTAAATMPSPGVSERVTPQASTPVPEQPASAQPTPEQYWVVNGLGKASPALRETLGTYRAKGVEDALLIAAMREAVEYNAKAPLPYIRTVLDKAVAAGHLTFTAWQAGRRPRGGGGASGGGRPRVDRAEPSGNDFLKNAARRRPLKKRSEKGTST